MGMLYPVIYTMKKKKNGLRRVASRALVETKKGSPRCVWGSGTHSGGFGGVEEEKTQGPRCVSGPVLRVVFVVVKKRSLRRVSGPGTRGGGWGGGEKNPRARDASRTPVLMAVVVVAIRSVK
jgi:hypothetical protein